MIKALELRELSVEELHGKIKDLESQLFDLKLQNSMSKLQNHSSLSFLRKDIARSKTILNQKLMAASTAKAGV